MDLITVEPWIDLARHDAPGSVTVICPLEPENPDRVAVRLRMRAHLDTAHALLAQDGMDVEARARLLEPLEALCVDGPEAPRGGQTLFAFLSDDVSRILQLDVGAGPQVTVGRHFHVRPLLGDGRTPVSMHVLSLSDTGARLLHGDPLGVTELPLPLARESRSAANGERVRPDGSGALHAHGSASGPKSQPQGFGHEQHDDIERDAWYRVVVDALKQALPTEERLIAVVADRLHQGPFARRCEAAGVAVLGIHHNPAGLTDEQLVELARPQFIAEARPDVEQLGARWAAAMSAGRCLLNAEQIALRAAEGRLERVLFDPDASVPAVLQDGVPHVATAHDDGHFDLVNDIVRDVLLHGGAVTPVTPGLLTRITGRPDANVAAITRW